MHKYIIEFGGGKIFSYERECNDTWYYWRLMRPHGDLFYSAENFSVYWNWFAAENADDEIAICFVCPVDEISLAEKIIAVAPKFDYVQDSTWNLSELKEFFSTCRLESTKENFSWNETSSEIIFDCGQKFRLSSTGNFSLHDDTEPPKEFSVPKSKFTVKVYSPAQRKKISELVTENKPEENSASDISPKTPLIDAKEKVTAEELQAYIKEQTAGQCITVSFKQ